MMLRKMQFAPNAFLNSLWTFSLEQLPRKRGVLSGHSVERSQRFRGETGTTKVRKEEGPQSENRDKESEGLGARRALEPQANRRED